MAAVTALESSVKQPHQPSGGHSGAADGNQLLTFKLGDELYGVDILRVQEIKGYTTVTRIPNTPAYIKGVINLRGTIVPIVELRTKFGMPTIDVTSFTVIIVVVVREKVMGLVVDAVSDVLTIDRQDIQAPPAFGSRVDVSCLSGIAKSGDKLVALLDIDRLLADGAAADGG
ncbi:chemotaxis protein CheW [Candidatus Nitrospira inopinata]|jgi:purine-binding chemotaxis protein CheW|uniref:Chemotaxis protein CheW n=1 Tax=Candidatus Nitrospira inopinata TaxID=1715989 RepID=A0A0S4KVP9_9BACT|nr:chemotaxis protein CheW [Candidatus Nitrospira inopinata]CUQ67258.1 purine-binding chemotaxis protein [Candidatus Nitrospira inopinata]